MSEPSYIDLLVHQQVEVAQQIHHVFQRSYRVEAKMLGISETKFPPLLRPVSSFQEAATEFVGYWVRDSLAAVTEINIKDCELMICSFVVDPEHFRKGIASSLLDHVLTKRDWTKAVVETGADNLPAIRLYEKFGFKEEKRWQIAELSVWKLRMVQISNK